MVNKNRNILSLKAGFYYTISNFIIRGMAFITTPIFTRFLSQNEYGQFNNIATWVSILVIITGFDAHTSIIRSRFDFDEDEMNSYILSSLVLSSLFTIIVYFIVIFINSLNHEIFLMDTKYINIIFLYLLVSPSFNMLQTKHRAKYRYKFFTFFSALSLCISTVFSILLVILMEDKLLGRVIGQYFPMFLLSLGIYLYFIIVGKKIKIKYWKYVAVLCFPLVPHLLSLNILGSSDKIMISNLCNTSATAIYSIAYTCTHIVSIFFDSLNKAWCPWLYDTLNDGDYGIVKRNGRIFYMFFSYFTIGILLAGPIIILILGGRNYMDAINVLPTLIVGASVQAVYTMYVNLEFYMKKTIGTAAASMLSAITNVVLNLIFIPIFGYVAAGYTTLFSYLVLLLCHYLIVKKIKMDFVYDGNFFCKILILQIIMIPIILFIYNDVYINVLAILIYIIISLLLCIKYKSIIISLIKKILF